MSKTFDIRCSYCGHGKMHYGEEATLRDQVRTDVFSCRCCGSAYDTDEIQKIGLDYMEAVFEVEDDARS